MKRNIQDNYEFDFIGTQHQHGGARPMNKTEHTALSFLRTATLDRSTHSEGYLPLALRQFHEEKKFPLNFIRKKNDTVGRLLHSLLLRNAGDITLDSAKLIARLSLTPVNATLPTVRYTGSIKQNLMIDRSMTMLNQANVFVGEGAGTDFTPPNQLLRSTELANVPIAIIGFGAAGILTYATLNTIGFKNIKIYDKNGTLGIWKQPNVNGGTKNNPRPIKFADHASLNQATGDGTKDGSQVVDFLKRLISVHEINTARSKTAVRTVRPSRNLDHRITFEDGDTVDYPIVINCIGTGGPRPLSDDKRMVQIKDAERPIPVRWQQTLDHDQHGRMFILIGLGNSTAEMLTQIHDLQKQGVDCDYRIFTHYPRDAIYNPSDAVAKDDRVYRVFRDLTKPDLTAYQGDLRRSRSDYYRALYEGKIIGDVRAWGIKNDRFHYRTQGYASVFSDRIKLHALIGYEHERGALGQMGIPTTRNYASAEYDGEFHDQYSHFPGYFGIGAVMDAPHNRNATVIPGIMYRMPDMLYSIVMRAAQYLERQNNGEPVEY